MKEYSGKFVLRLDPEKHRRLALIARDQNNSLNRICADLISAGLAVQFTVPVWQVALEKWLPEIKKKFGDALLGVAVFGSRANETATKKSDIDVLICLKPEAKINRAIYTWWDENFIHDEFEYNPVFAYPPEFGAAPSLWYEMAINHRILDDPQKILKNIFMRLMDNVYTGVVRRKWAQGQPYWTMDSV